MEPVHMFARSLFPDAGLRDRPPQAVLGACVNEAEDPADTYAVPQLVYANIFAGHSGQQERPGLRFNMFGRPTFDASCRAAWLWVRANIGEIWTRFGCRPADLAALRQSGSLPDLLVSSVPTYPKVDSSMGVCFAISMVSALTQLPVRREVGATGEMDVRGYMVLVGGVRVKAQGLAEVGVRTMLQPKNCFNDDLTRTGVDAQIECDSIWDMLHHALDVRRHHNRHLPPLPPPAPGAAEPEVSSVGFASTLEVGLEESEDGTQVEDAQIVTVECAAFLVPRRAGAGLAEVHLTLPDQQLQGMAEHALDCILGDATMYGPFPRFPWPLPADKALELHFHVSPIQGVEAGHGHYGVTMAVSLVAALTGRKTRPGVVLLGELMYRGRVVPTEALTREAGQREIGWLDQVSGLMQKLVIHSCGLSTMLQLISQHGSRRLRERVGVVGMTTLRDAIDQALV